MRLVLTLSIALALALLAWPASLAQEETPVVLRVDGNELSACPTASGQIACFIPTEGDPATAFMAGQRVAVELTAAGQAPHSINVVMEDDASPVHALTGTAFGTPIAQSAEVQGGESALLEFTVPESGTLYFYCGLPDHEPIGMFFTAEIQPAPEVEVPENETGTGGNGTTGNGTAGNNTGGDGGNTTASPEPSAPAADGNGTADDTNGTADGPSTDDEEAPLAPFALLIAGLVAVAAVARRHRRPA